MDKRHPPHWRPGTDRIAQECSVIPVTYTQPIPAHARCHYCGTPAASRDHIVPDSAGGSRLWWNLVPACKPCNESKGDRQACACMFCIRALALWQLGFRRTGRSHRDRKNNYKRNLRGLRA